jgi:uncharacterized caspase-like protein
LKLPAPTVRVCAAVSIALTTLAWSPPALAQRLPIKHALLFGVNRYQAEIQGVPKLDYAVPDAEELKEVLAERGWDARAFTNESVNRRMIIGELTRLAAEAEQQDTVLIYFAGHGVQDRVGRPHTYMLTYPSTLNTLAIESVRLNHLLEYVSDIPADRKIVLLDHCHSGDVERVRLPTTDGARATSGAVQVRPSTSTRDLFPTDSVPTDLAGAETAGLVILGSARGAAYEFPELGHGIFTYGLLEALRSTETDTDNNGSLSLSELWGAAQATMEKVKEEVAAAANIVQVPVEILQGTGLMQWDLIAAAVAAESGAAGLKTFIQELQQQGAMAVPWGMTCLLALKKWQDAKDFDLTPEPADEAVVQTLMAIRDTGDSFPWEIRVEQVKITLCQHNLITDCQE